MYRKINHWILFLLLIFSCEKDTIAPREFPSIRTLEITEISEQGARLSGELVRTGDEEIIDWGFVWDEYQKPTLGNSESKTLVFTPGQTLFSSEIRSTLIPETTYYVRAYAKSYSYVVYGIELSFESKGSFGPSIEDFFPMKGTLGDTISIVGKDFSNKPHGNIVKFDTLKSETVYASDSLILTLVPENLRNRKSQVSVEVAGKISATEIFFELIGPKIYDYSPKSGTIGDTVTIIGELFSNRIEENEVEFNNFSAEVIEAESNFLKVLVPLEINGNDLLVSVKVADITAVSDSLFNLTTTIIEEIFPFVAKIGDTIVIKGTDFSLIEEGNKASIDNILGKVVEASKSSLSVIVPDHSSSYPDITQPFPFSKIIVTVAGMTSNINNYFTYLAPLINSISPSSGTFSDTLTITGEYFSFFENELKVEINDKIAEILNITDTEIAFKLPLGITDGNPVIKVSTNYYSTSKQEAFSLLPPQIQTVSPNIVTFNDEILIEGLYFNPILSNNRIFVNGVEAQVLSGDGYSLTALVPLQIQTIDGSLDIILRTGLGYLNVKKENALYLKHPEIYSFSPQTMYDLNTPITINGAGFNPQVSLNDLVYNNMALNIIEVSPTKIIAEIPFEDYSSPNISQNSTDVIKMQSGGLYAESTDSLKVRWDALWTQKNDFPGIPRRGAVSFSLGSKGYLIGGDAASVGKPFQPLNDVWEYDPSNDSWTQKNDFPGGKSLKLIDFTYNNYAYVGLGYNENVQLRNNIWRYDAISDSWTEISVFPGEKRQDPIVFSIGNKAFIGAGAKANADGLHDFWEYDIELDSWRQKNSLDFFAGRARTNAYASTSLNGVGYSYVWSFKQQPDGSFSSDPLFLEYNVNSDAWSSTFYGSFIWGNGAHTVIGEKWYHFNKYFSFFDPNDSPVWGSLPFPIKVQHSSGIAFSINEIGYYGLGTPKGQEIPKSIFWEFDLSKYP